MTPHLASFFLLPSMSASFNGLCMDFVKLVRQWYAKLSTFLLSNNYSISIIDHSLFLKYNKDKLTVILVYVDDLC